VRLHYFPSKFTNFVGRTRASIRIGRVPDDSSGTLVTGNERVVDYLSESEGASVVSDTEEIPDPYSTSALGM
jgi:hypothetical protein